ncbi:hypothetical protein D3C85_197880 [compost metagenome]
MASGDTALPWGSNEGLHTGTTSSCMSSSARVPAQFSTCAGVPAYSAASNSASAKRKGRVRVSMCTTTSGCSAAKPRRRGTSQRVAKVGTAASDSDPPSPWCAMASSVSRSMASRRRAIWRA